MLENCLIRDLKECDLENILSWRNHPDVRKFMFSQHEISREEHWNWYFKSSQDKSRRLLIVENCAKAIGFVQFSKISNIGIAEWGFYVDPKSPKGMGKKLGLTALNYAFDKLKLFKICGQAVQENYASIAFHKYFGFSQEVTVQDQVFINDKNKNIYHFCLYSFEWQLKKLNLE